MEYDSIEGMEADCAKGLRHLLLACVDTKLLLGYHYGEWTFGTPELEAAVASCSLSQAELGHVRLFCAVLHKHFGDDPDQIIEGRPAHEYANPRFLDRSIPDWPAFVAMNYVVDLAATRLLHALRGSAFLPVRTNVEKMLDEERHHLHHGRGWFRTLAGGSRADRELLARRVGEALETVLEWMGPADHAEDRALVAARVKAEDNGTVAEAVRGDVLALATQMGLEVPHRDPTSFDGWDPATRRVERGGPEAQILAHLRGSKNAVYKLS